MSNQKLEIIFFDINNIIDDDEEKENNQEEIKEEKKENSIVNEAIGYFMDNHYLIDTEIEKCEEYNEYTFVYQIEKNVAKLCKFYLFTKLTQDSLKIDSNALFIFCDLEKEKNKKLLQKVIENIKRVCPQDIKIFIQGIIKSQKESVLNKETICQLFSNEECIFKYNEVNFNLNENIENDNNNNKNDNNIKEDNIQNENNDIKDDKANKKDENIYAKINSFIEEAMFDIYRYNNSKKIKISKKNSGNQMNKDVSCFIY